MVARNTGPLSSCVAALDLSIYFSFAKGREGETKETHFLKDVVIWASDSPDEAGAALFYSMIIDALL